jgi:hypothetical protein
VERGEFRAVLEPLLVAFGKSFDVPAWTVYFEALHDVPVSLLSDAVLRCVREAREFFPRAGELRAYAEEARLAVLAAHPWTPCALCEQHCGNVEVTDERGVKRMKACACRSERYERLGIPTRALTEGPQRSPDLDVQWDQVRPVDVRALPAPVIDMLAKVRTIAGRHGMPSARVQTDPDGHSLEHGR